VKNLRRPETAVERPLARRHALERIGEGGLLSRRERSKPQAGVRQEVALAVEASPPPQDGAPGDVGGQEQGTPLRQGHECRGIALDTGPPFFRLWPSSSQASHGGEWEDTGMDHILIIAGLELVLLGCLVVLVLKRPAPIREPGSASPGSRPGAGLTAHPRRSRRGRAGLSPPLPSTAPFRPGPDLSPPTVLAWRESFPGDGHVDPAWEEAPPYSPLELRQLLEQRPPDVPRES